MTVQDSYTPLDKLLQDDLSLYIGPQADSGCLVLVPAQTGIGKTHSILQLILTELAADEGGSEPARRIYYVTNSVDNVRQSYNGLLEMIDVKLPKSAASLKRQILYLPRQDSQMQSVSDAVVERVIELFSLQTNRALQDKWREMRKMRRFMDSHTHSKGTLQSSLDQLAQTTYGLLVNAIQSRQRSDQPLQLSDADMELLDCLLPGDRMARGEARVAFLTTHKFMGGYQTLRGRTHPLRELDNALLLIDEFDRQNEVILQIMAEQKALDLVELTRTLHANLQLHQVERSSRYVGIEEQFDSLRTALREFAQRWHLEFAFNTEGDSFEDEKVRLFSDRTVTHAHSSEHLFRLSTDQQLRKNVIHTAALDREAEQESFDKRLSRFINEADWVYRRFIWVMRSSVWRYMQNTPRGDGEARVDSATLQEAVMSILSHLNLQRLSDVVFAALDVQTSLVGGREHRSSADIRAGARTYHDKGLKLTDVRRNEGTRDTVSCYFTGLAVTPSGLLARMVEGGAKVVGVSATATSRTVIRNFDLTYLQGRLGSRFIELTPGQQEAVGDWYRSRRRYADTGVHIDVQFTAEDRGLVAEALENVSGRPVSKPAMALGHLFGEEEGSDYRLSWVSKLLAALAGFMAARDNRYMLVLLNRTISSSRYPEFVRFLENYLQRAAAESGTGVRLFDGMNAEAMAYGEFDQVLRHLSGSADKVVVLSAYASMGEGKNPDYTVQQAAELEQLVWVGDGQAPIRVKTDIDTLYLEKPTHQLLSSEDYQVGQLLLLHQIMALQESGWISLAETRTWVREALQGMAYKKHLGKYHKTGDYVWLIRKVIEQAVGRTARTAFKRPVIRLFADNELAPFLSGDERSPTVLSHEYSALVAAARNYCQPCAASREYLLPYNRAALSTADTLSLIRELMSGFRGAAGESAIASWDGLRKQLLAAPTIADPSSDYPRLYLQAPTTDGYRFSGGLEVDREYMESDRNLLFFDQAIGGRWISDEESGLPLLMRNPVVREHFEQKGWATRWRPYPYTMNPAAFFNIYKAALGEEGVLAILQHMGLKACPLPAEVYEFCDFLLRPHADQPPIGIDAKHWRTDGAVEHHSGKFEKLRAALGMRRFVYINLFGSAEQSCRYLCNELKPALRKESSVLEVPGLVDLQTGETIKDHLTTLLEWISEADDCPDHTD